MSRASSGYFQHKGMSLGSTVNSAVSLSVDQLRTGQSMGQLRRYSSLPQATEISSSEQFLAALCLAKQAEIKRLSTCCQRRAGAPTAMGAHLLPSAVEHLFLS